MRCRLRQHKQQQPPELQQRNQPGTCCPTSEAVEGGGAAQRSEVTRPSRHSSYTAKCNIFIRLEEMVPKGQFLSPHRREVEQLRNKKVQKLSSIVLYLLFRV